MRTYTPPLRAVTQGAVNPYTRGGLDTQHEPCQLLRRMKFLGEPRSGSLAGQTSSRNRFGQYVRSRATPVNPNSVAQAAVRARQSNNAAAWRTITDTQRAGWA